VVGWVVRDLLGEEIVFHGEKYNFDVMMHVVVKHPIIVLLIFKRSWRENNSSTSVNGMGGTYRPMVGPRKDLFRPMAYQKILNYDYIDSFSK
jgi:hypothetical protein